MSRVRRSRVRRLHCHPGSPFTLSSLGPMMESRRIEAVVRARREDITVLLASRGNSRDWPRSPQMVKTGSCCPCQHTPPFVRRSLHPVSLNSNFFYFPSASAPSQSCPTFSQQTWFHVLARLVTSQPRQKTIFAINFEPAHANASIIPRTFAVESVQH